MEKKGLDQTVGPLSHAHPVRVRAWCLYDVANSAFTTTVVAAVLPEFFSSVAGAGLDTDPTQAKVLATSLWARANYVVMILTALSAPLVGAFVDVRGRPGRMLAALAFAGAALTGALVGVGAGDWQLALGLYITASVAWSASLVVYDGLLPAVASRHELDGISARGFAWGYLGGGLLLALQLVIISFPARFGLPNAEWATRLCFVSVGIWWAAFSVPLIRHAPRTTTVAPSVRQASRLAMARLGQTLRDLRQHRDAFRFLIAFWLYNDGIGTIVRMAVILGAEIGIGRGHLIGAILLVQILGFPFSLLFGRLARSIGARNAIFLGVAGYLLLCGLGFAMQTAAHFWMLAAGVSMFQGGTQALSRSLFASLIPHDRSGEFFGFYNLSGKFAGLLGTATFALAGPWLGSSRYGVLGLVVLFLAGAAVLATVRIPDQAKPSNSST